MGAISKANGAAAAGRAATVAGQNAQTAANYEADQLDQNANTAIAVGQAKARDARREGNIVLARMQAISAASGGSATDPSIVMATSRMAGEASYRAALDLYEGDDKARALRAQATATRLSGSAAGQGAAYRSQAYGIAGQSAMLEGAGSMFAKFGGGGVGASGGGGAATVAGGDSFFDAGVSSTPMANFS